MEEYISFGLCDTEEIAAHFAERLIPGDVVALSGELGTGKTTLTKAIAKNLGYDGEVTSPTYTLINEYDGKMPIYHFDAYRIEKIKREDLDFMDDYLFGEGVCIIEWAEYVSLVLPRNTYFIRITKNSEKGENYRKITVRKGE